MFRTQSASIFRSNFLQTVVAATGVCRRYGVDKSRIGVIGSVCIILGSIDVDGLAMPTHQHLLSRPNGNVYCNNID